MIAVDRYYSQSDNKNIMLDNENFITAYEIEVFWHLDLGEQTAGLVIRKAGGVTNREGIWS